jgi:hypothetical protein
MTAVLGDLHRAGQLHRETLDLAHRLGAVGFIRWQEAEHVFYCYWEGRWDEALSAAGEFLEEAEARSSHYMGSACRDTRAAIWLGRNDLDAALAEARRATELALAVGDSQTLNPALALEARILVAAGKREGAAVLADQLVARWASNGIRQPLECADAPWVFRNLARADEMQEWLQRAASRTPWLEAASLILDGEFEQAADVYAAIGSVPDEAYSRLRAADELVRSGQRAGADQQLGLALPVFARLGASAWQAEAEALLAESA